MTTLREAAQQALEAMEYSGMDVGKFNRVNAACAALRAALEQPEHKPMHPEIRKMWEDYFDKCFREQPVQEPVAIVRTWHKNGAQHAELDDWGLGIASLSDGKHNLYTAPPQRQPLPDGQILAMYNNPETHADMIEFARAIERAHGIGGSDE